jgi:hypothetical protein
MTDTELVSAIQQQIIDVNQHIKEEKCPHCLGWLLELRRRLLS